MTFPATYDHMYFSSLSTSITELWQNQRETSLKLYALSISRSQCSTVMSGSHNLFVSETSAGNAVTTIIIRFINPRCLMVKTAKQSHQKKSRCYIDGYKTRFNTDRTQARTEKKPILRTANNITIVTKRQRSFACDLLSRLKLFTWCMCNY